MLTPTAAAAFQPVAAQQDSVSLLPGALLAARLRSDARAITRSDTSLRAWRLPFAYTAVTREGTVLELYPEVEVDGGGLRVDTATGWFHGRIRLAVVDAQGRTGQAIEAGVRLFVTSAADHVDPGTVRIRETGVPTTVRLAASAPAESVLVRVRSDIDTTSVAIYVPVIRPQLHLSVTPATIQGLGLQTARLVVRATGLPAYNHRVEIVPDRGDVETAVLTLDRHGFGETVLRSAGVGLAAITVSGAPFQGDSAALNFAFPWIFLVVALAGGLLGSWVRERRKPTAGASRRGRIEVGLLRGAVMGLVVAAAYAVGINVLGVTVIARAGETLTFVLAVLGGYAGSDVLRSQLSPRQSAGGSNDQ